MRWLKHMTATRKDEKVAALIHKAGHDGYGLWWMVLETVAASMDKGSTKCSLKYPVSKWATELQLLPQHVCRKLVALHVAGLLELRKDGDAIELTIPNLLKYRDEYARKSGHTPDSVRSKIQRQNTDTDTDTEYIDFSNEKSCTKVAPQPVVPAPTGKAKKNQGYSPEFLEFWGASWKRGSKFKAWQAYRRLVKGKRVSEVLAAVRSAAIAYEPCESQFKPHLATWLNQHRWQQPLTDFVDDSQAIPEDDYVTWLANLPTN